MVDEQSHQMQKIDAEFPSTYRSYPVLFALSAPYGHVAQNSDSVVADDEKEEQEADCLAVLFPCPVSVLVARDSDSEYVLARHEHQRQEVDVGCLSAAFVALHALAFRCSAGALYQSPNFVADEYEGQCPHTGCEFRVLCYDALCALGYCFAH